jgi:hypothetical protein
LQKNYLDIQSMSSSFGERGETPLERGEIERMFATSREPESNGGHSTLRAVREPPRMRSLRRPGRGSIAMRTPAREPRRRSSLRSGIALEPSIDPRNAALKPIDVLQSLTPENSGSFRDWAREPIPW